MIITSEFKRGIFTNLFPLQNVDSDTHSIGAEIVDKIIIGTAEWSELFAKHDFFHRYRYYLQVIASTGSSDRQIKW